MEEGEAFAFLRHWFDAADAQALVRIITGPRMRCARCSNCVRLNNSRASGAYCLPCAILIERREQV
jgi:late competence protein required for DNA uptake (superfamily II DNA/RNA helicase)